LNATFQPTDEQRFLIELPTGCHLVKAPPGAGKTLVLTQRIAMLLTREPGASFRILALTFTTKAAETLRERVNRLAGEAAKRVNACTFHSFCRDVLQHHGDAIAFAPDTTIYEAEHERLKVLARALDDEGIRVEDDNALRKILVRIGWNKRSLRAPEGVRERELSRAYAAYDRLLRQYHACDFDDLLWQTWRLFVEVPKVARLYRRMYRHIMVDEAQDSNRAQYELLRVMCGDEHRNVMMVADCDQFIYRFNGASAQWLNAFVRDFSAEQHALTQNFRSAAAIIEVANKLAKQLPEHRLGRELQANEGLASSHHSEGIAAVERSAPERERMFAATAAPGLVEAWSCADERAEARAVVDWIERLLAEGLDRRALYPDEPTTIRPEDLCVLCRTRWASTSILAELENRGIAYLFSMGRELVETREGRLVVQGLKLIANASDRISRESVLAAWAPNELDTELAELPPPQFLRALNKSEPSFQPFGQILLAALERALDVGELVRELFDVLARLARDAADCAPALLADLETLEERWRQYAGHLSPSGRSVGGFLAELSLGGKSVINGPGIRVLTIHAAKGMEFKAVALVGLNEGTLPDYRNASRSEDVTDERRIAYVAITRASRQLLLTRPRQRELPRCGVRPQKESRFVGEMRLEMTAR
jgi:DNA helicase-2/ATP-dependent DNA helicase PcrA